MAAKPCDNRSWLHRVLRIQAGDAPAWLWSPDNCDRLDVPHLVLGLIPISALLLYRYSAIVSAIVCYFLLAVSAVLAVAVMMPFDECERNARALRRQREDSRRDNDLGVH